MEKELKEQLIKAYFHELSYFAILPLWALEWACISQNNHVYEAPLCLAETCILLTFFSAIALPKELK